MNTTFDVPGAAVFDRDGFLINPDILSEGLADRIASADGLTPLNDMQFGVLHALREEFMRNGNVTALSHICHLVGQNADCMQHLFPNPREAWRLAGLPNPGEEAKAYL